MANEIIVAIITGGLSFLGVVISNINSNKKMTMELKNQQAVTGNKIAQELEKQQAVTDTKIEELTREVRAHNNFASRIPVIENDIKVANHRISDLEKKLDK